jgi:hypothetical protein
VCLAAVLATPVTGWPQQVSGPKSNLQGGGGLKITVVQGEGAINNTRTKTGTAPAVEVRDDSDKPVAGAEVVFQLPAAGPGGVFNGWMRNQTARSDEQGRAAASGFTPNDEEGRFNIKVMATQGSKTATVVIGQSNSRTGGTGDAKGASSHKGLWIAIGVLAVVGIIAGVALTRGDDTVTTTTNPVTITPGPVSVGGPR